MPVYQNLSDNELIAFLREGDAAAYTEIYDRYFQLMFVFAYKKLRDEELAKDFVQEQFTGIWHRRESLSVEGNFSSFMFTSMRNRMLDYFAHQKVRNRYVDFLASYSLQSSKSTDFLIREKQMSDYIERQIVTLPSKMRHIFELSRKQHLSHKEIAAVLETSEHNVSKQITNALRILKVKLGRSIILMFF
ncbi:RNA polymerase sigma factor [Pedobacter xixiisoli]|nr:RNA polymerase sigma-70 factor [Pedobacter xixiisoli]